MFALKLPGAACSRAAAIVIKWIAGWADPPTNKKQKNTLPTVAACWQTTLKHGSIRWFDTASDDAGRVKLFKVRVVGASVSSRSPHPLHYYI
jgi:hypothetical protein